MQHVGEIATMAIDLLAAVKQVALPKSVGKGHIQIRVGIHTGACNTSSFCFGYKIIYLYSNYYSTEACTAFDKN